VRVRPPRMLLLPGLGSPCVWGLGRPLLLWPASLVGSLPPERERAVLLHELAHLRRRDHWVSWLLLAGACLWWWNPLFWYVRRQVCRHAELACDAWVVATLPEGRRAYAEALLQVCQLVSRRAVPAAALGMGGHRQDFERRLIMIMRQRGPCQLSLSGLLVLGLLALVALPGWSQGQKATEPEKQPAAAGAPGTPKDVDAKQDRKRDLSGFQVLELASGDLEVLLTPADPAKERDRKLQEVEKKLQALLKEVQALRTGGPTATTAKVQLIQERLLGEYLRLGVRVEGTSPVVNLTRASYKLPKDKAEALVSFLRGHVRAQVLETRVEGDSLIITTLPETQQAIGQLVALIQGKASAGAKPKPQPPQAR